jgi:hypothetical protein
LSSIESSNGLWKVWAAFQLSAYEPTLEAIKFCAMALAPRDGEASTSAKTRSLGRCEQYKAARADKMSASQLHLSTAASGYRCASRFNRLRCTIGALSGFDLGGQLQFQQIKSELARNWNR